MKKVLILEDDPHILEMFDMMFEDLEELETVVAISVDEAMKKFSAHTDFDAIIVDGCIQGEGEDPNTLPLVRLFRRAFRGPMIATSSVPHFNTLLVGAGCNHACEKGEIHRKLKEVLGTQT